MAVGDSASLSRTFTQDDIDAFARLSGDDNPAHVDAEWGAASVFGGRVAREEGITADTFDREAAGIRLSR